VCEWDAFTLLWRRGRSLVTDISEPRPDPGPQSHTDRPPLLSPAIPLNPSQPAKKNFLTALPPEILSQIFLRPSTASDEPFLPVQSTPVCRALLPFTRAAAYRHLTFDSPIALAAFGFTLSQPECAHLGLLVESVNVLEPRQTRGGFADEAASVAWLGASFRRAFEGMPNLEEVRVTRAELLEGEDMMRTAGWQSVRKVVVASRENVGYEALRWLHLAPNLTELEVVGPMRYEASFPGRVSAFEPAKSSIKKLTINAEPHSAGK